ncbi:hypothetical protein GE21DRAFT_1223815, partial [Neurospora crassa]
YYFTGWTKPSDLVVSNRPPLATANTSRPPLVVINNRLPLLVTANTNPPPLDIANNPPLLDIANTNRPHPLAKATAKSRDSESDDEPLTPRRFKKVAENLVKRIITLKNIIDLMPLLKPPIIAIAVAKAL